MAERRMFTKRITDDDNFLALSSAAQALYLHLSMSADDDGFCNQVALSMFRAHASISDLQALLDKRYLYQFENGVIVIKHWRMANALRKDRYSPTVFQEELQQLGIKENGSYTMVAERLPDGCQVVAERLPQDRLGKDRLDKVSIGEDRLGEITVSLDTVCRTETVQRILDKWNQLEHLGIKSIKKITQGTKRYDSLMARIKQYGEDEIMKAIDQIAESDFLQGKNSKGWVITFDWFVLPNNFPKVLEGNYDNREKQPTGSAYIDAINHRYDVIEEWLEGETS